MSEAVERRRYTCVCGAWIEGTDISPDSYWFKLHEPHEDSWLDPDDTEDQ